MSNDADRTLVWPDGSIYGITRSSADTDGELLEMELQLPAHGWPPKPHVHPRLTEEYQVLEGSFDVLVGSEWRTLTAGDGASVPPGTVHTFRVRGSPVRVRNVHRPALDFEPYDGVPRTLSLLALINSPAVRVSVRCLGAAARRAEPGRRSGASAIWPRLRSVDRRSTPRWRSRRPGR